MRAVKLIIFVALCALLAFAAVFWFLRSRNNEAGEVVVPERSDLYEEIFATGKVRPAEELKLSFQAGGLISGIYVKEGETVAKGRVLAQLDTEELENRLKEAKAQLSAREASLALAHVQLQNAKDALFTRIGDSYNKIDEAFFTDTEPLFRGGIFGLSIQEGATTYSFNTSDLDLELSLNDWRKELLNLILSWRQLVSRENLMEQAKLAMQRLQRLRDFINDLAQAVSHFSTDKTTIAATLNSYRSSVSSAQSSISSAIVNLDSAMQNLVAAESNVSDAGVEQAKRQIEILQTQLKQTRLVSPLAGTILTKQAKTGEVTQAGSTIFTFYPKDQFRVEAEIYEGDIGTISVGEKAKLEFIAFPEKTFAGEVVEIDRAPLLIDGVVHYLATLRIIDAPEQILPGMSVDVRFLSAQEEGNE